MERLDKENSESPPNSNQEHQDAQHRRRVFFGILLIGIGGWWMLHRLEILFFPDWLFTWPMILIAVGLANLITHKFRNVFGYIMLLLGTFFLLRYNFDFPYELQKFFWPGLLITIGLVFLLRPNPARQWRKRMKQEYPDAVIADEKTERDGADHVGETVIMGALKKELSNDNFKGGRMTCVMGGAELYLGNSDLKSSAVLDVTCVMGGVELIVPKDWDVHVTATSILAGVDDKREFRPTESSQKRLTVTGTILLGGLEIRTA